MHHRKKTKKPKFKAPRILPPALSRGKDSRAGYSVVMMTDPDRDPDVLKQAREIMRSEAACVFFKTHIAERIITKPDKTFGLDRVMQVECRCGRVMKR